MDIIFNFHKVSDMSVFYPVFYLAKTGLLQHVFDKAADVLNCL